MLAKIQIIFLGTLFIFFIPQITKDKLYDFTKNVLVNYYFFTSLLVGILFYIFFQFYIQEFPRFQTNKYLDLIILNSNEYMIIENDGDLLYGEYTFDDISESDTEILLKNNTLFDKPGSKIESLDQRSYNLSFPSNSPKETSVIAPDLSYSDSYTRTKYEFELPSGQMPKSLIGKKMKIYIFSSSSDFCGYTEIDFDSVDDASALLKIGSGFTPVNVFYKLKTDSAANLIVNGVSPMLVKYPNLSTSGPLYIEQINDVRFTADLNLYAKDSECGFFFGHYITEVNPTI